MTNVNLEPGHGRHRSSELIADTDERDSAWRPTARGRSTTGGSTSSSRARPRGRSAAASAGPAAAQPELLGRHAASSGEAATRSARHPVGRRLAGRLRQGRARPVRPRLARGGAGPLPGRARWGLPELLELAERALRHAARPRRARLRRTRALAAAALRRQPAHAGHRGRRRDAWRSRWCATATWAAPPRTAPVTRRSATARGAPSRCRRGRGGAWRLPRLPGRSCRARSHEGPRPGHRRL